METSRLSGANHYKAFVQWARMVLYSQLLSEGHSVLEVQCGNAADFGKLQRVNIGSYVGTDVDANALSQAKQRAAERKVSIPVEFSHHDFLEELSFSFSNNSFDRIISHEALRTAFSSEESVSMLLKNVSRVLKPGGLFFGTVLDSSAVWSRATKASENITSGSVIIRGDSFLMKLDSQSFSKFGTKFAMSFRDILPLHGVLVHFPTLIEIAGTHGLECLYISNLLEFYELNHGPYKEGLISYNVFDKAGKIPKSEMDLIGMFAIFVFRKNQ